MTDFCKHRQNGTGISCDYCGCWKAGVMPPSCPTYITRTEPNLNRIPHIKTIEDNNVAYDAWWKECERENERNMKRTPPA